MSIKRSGNIVFALLLLALSLPYDPLFGPLFGTNSAGAATPHQSTSATSNAQPGHPVSNEELVQKLRNAKVIDAAYRLSVTIGSDEVAINTQRDPSLDDDKVKIQAVLIAKTALESMPNSVSRAKVIFADKNGQEVVPIKREVISLFGSRKVNEKDLLALVDINKSPAKAGVFGEIPEAELKNIKVVKGPNELRRVGQQARINMLKNSGTDVRKLQEMFDAQEKLAARAKSVVELGQLEQSIQSLGVKIRGQYQMLMEARGGSHPPRRWFGGNQQGRGTRIPDHPSDQAPGQASTQASVSGPNGAQR